MPCISGTPQSLTDSLITGTFKVYPVIGYLSVILSINVKKWGNKSAEEDFATSIPFLKMRTT
jgi:hypothetical protein